MNPGRRAGLALIALAAVSLGPQAAAAEPPVERVRLLVVPETSFEELLAVPEVRQVARAGGAALMSSETLRGDEGTGAFLTLGTGARAAGPAEVRTGPTAIGDGRITDMDALRSLNEGHAVPGLLGASVSSACAHDPLGGLVAMDASGTYPWFGADRSCTVEVQVVEPREVGDAIRDTLAWWEGDRGRLIIVGPNASAQMRAAGDELTPIVLADGTEEEILSGSGPMPTLASDTTHQTGVVSNEDVAPTILDGLGLPVPSDMKGNALRISQAPAPLDLHERYLANVRVRTAAAAVGGGLLLACLAFGTVVFFRRDRVSSRTRLAGRWALLAGPSLAAGLVFAGRLPSQGVASVGVLMLVCLLLVPWVALRTRSRGPLTPAFALGALILIAASLEVAGGTVGMRFTLLGATSLDGGRFFGFHNVAIGLLLGASLYVAASLRPWTGAAVIAYAGVLLGMPWAGSNLGAAVTLFAATGIWLFLRLPWPRLRRALAGVAVFGAGMAVTLAAHRFLTAVPTHGTRFVEVAGDRPGSILATFLDRLAAGIDLLVLNPAGLAYLVATPVLLWVLSRPRGVWAAVAERTPAWRLAMLTILWSCVVAYFFNDTGVAAVGLGFLMALVGAMEVPLALEPEKIEAV